MNKLKRLTWKYFKEQKIKDILNAFKIILISFSLASIVISISYFIGGFFDATYLSDRIMLGMIFIFFSFIIGFMLIYPIIIWILSNWEEAKQRAIDEIGLEKIK